MVAPSERDSIYREGIITSKLAHLRYVRLSEGVLRATWSTEDVEHFFYFWRHGAVKQLLTADYGFRNVAAERFSRGCVRRYGGPVYQVLRDKLDSDCSMRFSLGSLAGWAPRSSLSMENFTVEEIGEKMKADAAAHLLPLIQKITSLSELIKALISCDEPFSWKRTNGAIRAAQIVVLGIKLGLVSKDVMQILEPMEREIAVSLDRRASIREYIEKSVQFAVGALGQTDFRQASS